MRVLIVAGPMHGHVNTLIPLALAAHRAGHDVAFATGPELVERVESFGLHAWPIETRGLDRPGVGTDFVSHFIAAARVRGAELVPRAVEWRPDVVLHEETELAGALAARAAGALHAIHGLSLMLPMRIWDVFETALDSLFAEWDIAATGRSMRDVPYIDICPNALQPPGERVWENVLSLRPAIGLPTSETRLPIDLDALPYDRTAHLTLGTVFFGASDVFGQALAGLRQVGVNLVVTTGPGTDPSQYGVQPAHVAIEPYLPHALLLPWCDLVVSQGGAGVMYATLALGIPQLALPQGGDQHMLAEALVGSGAGLALMGDEVTPAAVAEAATRLLEDPRFAAAAEAVRDEIASRPDADEVFAQISELV